MLCHIAKKNIEVGKRWQWEPKHVLLPPFSCSIAHARIALYVFVNPESLRLNWTIVQLNCDLGETPPFNSPPCYFPHSFLLSFPLLLAHTYTSSCHTQTQMNQMCCTAKPRGHEPKDNCREGIVPEGKQGNGQIIRLWGYQRSWCNHMPFLGFLRQQPHDPCQAIVSWCETGVMSDRKAYCTFLTISQWRSRKQANIKLDVKV